MSVYTSLEDTDPGDDDQGTSICDEETSLCDDSLENVPEGQAFPLSPALVAAYTLVWLTYLAEAAIAATTAVLAPYVASAFAHHSLTPAIGLVSSLVAALAALPLARLLDRFGRPRGLGLCVVLASVGLALAAASSSASSASAGHPRIGLALYAAAQLLQSVGHAGIQYVLAVFIADTAPLRARGLVQSVLSSPNLLVCWLAGPLADACLRGPGWPAAFALFAILLPTVTLPLLVLLVRLVPAPTSPDSTGDNTEDSLVSTFDLVGLFLLAAAFLLLLLPLNLDGWSPSLVTTSLALGCTLSGAFVLWESRFAPVTLVPYAALLDRTVAGACLLSAVLFSSFWCWNSFFGSYLQVVNDLSVTGASFVTQSYTVCSVLCSVAVGLLIHRTGRFRPVCLHVGVPLSILGSGLMLFFCKTDAHVAPLVMCEIFISIAAGTVMVCDEVAILAAASDQQVAVSLALLGFFGNIGGAFGLTASSAIWQHIFPSRLAAYLPSEEVPNLGRVYADLATQLSYPIGSAARVAIQHAYQDAQVWMLAASTAIWAAGLVGVLLWRDINVTNGHNKTV